MPRSWRGSRTTSSASPGATSDSMSAAPSRTFPELAKLELGRGVCGIKIFAGSSTGDLMVEDDEHLERVMRSGRRRIAYHSEDEYRLQERRPLFKSGDPYRRHMEWRDEETRVPRHAAADGAGARDRAAGAYPARLHRGGTRLPEGLPRSRDLRGAGEPPDPGGAGLLRHAERLRRDEPADPRAAPPRGGAGARSTTARSTRSAPTTRRMRATRSCCRGRIVPPG